MGLRRESSSTACFKNREIKAQRHSNSLPKVSQLIKGKPEAQIKVSVFSSKAFACFLYIFYNAYSKP